MRLGISHHRRSISSYLRIVLVDEILNLGEGRILKLQEGLRVNNLDFVQKVLPHKLISVLLKYFPGHFSSYKEIILE